MTKDEIKKMVNTCDNYYSCALCPYNPEDISRFIGDRWKGGCPDYDRKLVYAMGKGYGNISEYKAEIDDLKAENKQLKTECALLDDELRIARQETIDVLNKVKEKLNNTPNGSAYTTYIDELLKEYEK